MAQNQVRRIPILDNSKVVGIITLGDLSRNQEINDQSVCNTLEDICCNKTNKNAE